MFFDELNNDEWALLAPLVSDEPAVRLNRRGRPRAEPRIVTNAVLWILTTGEPWSKLPGRYPSGPTCRRRFEEWQLNGTLLEMVRLLSQSGRTFAYIPEPVAPVAAKPTAPAAPTSSVRDEGLRGVSWKSPESWQAPGVSGTPSQWRSADPIADITRQLSGLAQGTPASAPAASIVGPALVGAALAQRQAAFGAGVASMNAATDALTSAASPGTASVAPMADTTNTTDALDERAAPGAASFASVQSPPAQADQRTPLSISLAPHGAQVADPRGYVIYVVGEQVPGAAYRGWAEIIKDGKRVERSGLVGPRFADERDAQQYALDWARQWIDRQCEAQAVAPAQVAPSAMAATASAPAAPAYAQRPLARSLPAMRHAAEPASVNGAGRAPANHSASLHDPLDAPLGAQAGGPPNGQLSGPLNAPLNALRGPLRRYPAEPAVGVTTGTADSTGSERFSTAYLELISHVG